MFGRHLEPEEETLGDDHRVGGEVQLGRSERGDNREIVVRPHSFDHGSTVHGGDTHWHVESANNFI